MNVNDERIHRYLSAQAERINPPALELGRIIDRSVQRHRRRRAGVGIAAIVVVVAAAGIVATRGGSSTNVKVAGSGQQVVDSPFDWTIVDQAAGSGIGWTTTLAATADGTTYSLSTAPGILPPSDTQQRATLYRSTNGATWEQVGLPADMWASALSASGGRLYAVGTAPDGGGKKLMLAATDDGGATWTPVDLPLPTTIADLEARYPNQIAIGGPSVASGPTGVVAAVDISAFPDLTDALANLGYGPEYNWSQTSDGVDVFKLEGCETPPSTEATKCVSERGTSTPVAHFTWEQLGVPAELQSLIKGELHVFAAGADGTFHEVGVPASEGAGAQVVADASGYRLVVNARGSDQGGSTLLTSADGETWTAAPLNSGGWVSQLGVVGGRLAFASMTPTGSAVVSVDNGAGGWDTIDLSEAIGSPPEQTQTLDVKFGPLGVAALVAVGDMSAAPQLYLVHSPDGVNVSVVDLSKMLAGQSVHEWPAGITVTADAITVRFTAPTGEDPTQPPTEVPGQVLIVGTPR